MSHTFTALAGFLQAVADVERAILKALEKQYNDILTPLKDTIPKRLNMHVQKLTRRQSMAIYSVPNQVGAPFSLYPLFVVILLLIQALVYFQSYRNMRRTTLHMHHTCSSNFFFFNFHVTFSVLLTF